MKARTTVICVLAMFLATLAPQSARADVAVGGSSIFSNLVWGDDFTGGASSYWIAGNNWRPENNQLRVDNSSQARINLSDIFGANYKDVLGSVFIIQFDALMSNDRTNLNIGTAFTNDGHNTAGGFSIFYRNNGDATLYDTAVDQNISSKNDPSSYLPNQYFNTIGTPTVGNQWHNVAMKFNLTDNTLEYFLDEVSRGVVNLDFWKDTGNKRFNIGAGSGFDPLYIGIGPYSGGGLFDNFQIGNYGASLFYNSVADGVWGVGGTWDKDAVPGGSDLIVVQNGHQVRVAAPGAVGGSLTVNGALTVESGGALAVGAMTISNGGAVRVDGRLSTASIASLGTMTLAGTLAFTGATDVQLSSLNVTGNNAAVEHAQRLSLAKLTMAEAGAVVTKRGAGTMNITELAGESGTIRIAEGTYEHYGSTAGNGNTFELAGGKLALMGQSYVGGGEAGLRQYYFEPSNHDYDGANQVGNLVGKFADGTRAGLFDGFSAPTESVTTSQLYHANTSDADNFAYVWSGFFTADTTGYYNLRSRSDDKGRLWIDANRNGVYDTGEVFLASNAGADASGRVYLEAGESYGVVFSFSERGGSEYWEFFLTPPGGAETLVMGTGNQGGTWSVGQANTPDFTDMNVRVSAANSVLDINAPNVRLGGLELTAGSDLRVEGAAKNIHLQQLSGSGKITFGETGNRGTLLLGVNEDSVWSLNIFDDGTGNMTSDFLTLDTNLTLGDRLTLDLNLLSGDLAPTDEFLLATLDGMFDTVDATGAQGSLADILFSSLSETVDFSGAMLELRNGDSQLWLTGLTGTNGNAATPEPATWLMLVLGMLGLAFYRKNSSRERSGM